MRRRRCFDQRLVCALLHVASHLTQLVSAVRRRNTARRARDHPRLIVLADHPGLRELDVVDAVRFDQPISVRPLQRRTPSSRVTAWSGRWPDARRPPHGWIASLPPDEREETCFWFTTC